MEFIKAIVFIPGPGEALPNYPSWVRENVIVTQTKITIKGNGDYNRNSYVALMSDGTIGVFYDRAVLQYFVDSYHALLAAGFSPTPASLDQDDPAARSLRDEYLSDFVNKVMSGQRLSFVQVDKPEHVCGVYEITAREAVLDPTTGSTDYKRTWVVDSIKINGDTARGVRADVLINELNCRHVEYTTTARGIIG